MEANLLLQVRIISYITELIHTGCTDLLILTGNTIAPQVINKNLDRQLIHTYSNTHTVSSAHLE
jgi:hypothetical protein